LKNLADDFTYVLGLQEASVLAMADGFAQSTGRPALVNVHTSAGLGNAMGSLVAAYKGNIPPIVTAGQQTREMVLCETYLTNRDETVFPQPWVKWAYQPARAEDVPAAFMRAYAVALQPPAGPVFLSIPLDDWEKPASGPAIVRTVSHRASPDTQRLHTFADRLHRRRTVELRARQRLDTGRTSGSRHHSSRHRNRRPLTPTEHGYRRERVLVVIESSPARFAVEGGRVQLEPGHEQAWIAGSS
jgi:thiamine pyrophosphate-dependent acetolactate synthase large subunit-like protein